MSEVKHTPGPWEAWLGKSTYGTTGPAAAATDAAIHGVRNCVICREFPVIQIAAKNKTAPALAFGNTKEEAEANAILMASAPELLDALRPFAALLDAIEHMGGTYPKSGTIYSVTSHIGGHREITVEQIAAARAIVARATGAAS